MVHGDQELRAVTQSHHESAGREDMLYGIRAHHEAVSKVNPAWALDLLRQLSAVEATNGEGYATAARGVVRPAELCDLALRLGPWWI